MQQSKNSTRALFISCSAFVGFLLSSCSSIVHSGSRTVSINSQPAGAAVTVTKANDGTLVHSGVTPLTVSLDPKGGFFKGQSYAVRFRLAGYKTEEVMIRPQLSGWYFGNLVVGGLVGMLIVDPVTGSMWNLTPDQIDRKLTSQQTALLKTGDGFVVSLVSELSEAERSKMVRIN